MPEISVVMPVWIQDEETLQLTVAAVESIRDGTPNCYLIIIDNASTHGAAVLRELADVYIRNKENLGYAKAVNQGLKLSGDIVAIANNDIIPSKNWWEVAREILINNVSVGSVHFRMIPYGEQFNLGSQTWEAGKERWCSSSFFVVRNEQLYDEEYLNSIDDWDYWRRFREGGSLTAYTNKAQYQHKDSHTQKMIPNRSENDTKNRQHYFRKFGETPEDWMARMYPEQLKEPWKPMP